MQPDGFLMKEMIGFDNDSWKEEHLINEGFLLSPGVPVPCQLILHLQIIMMQIILSVNCLQVYSLAGQILHV